MSVGLQQDSDEIVRSLGDILLHLGCDTGWLVPNTALNASAVNARIAQYQLHLDKLELEITTALAAARRRLEIQPAEESKPEVQEEEKPEELDCLKNNDSINNDEAVGGNDDMDFFSNTEQFGQFNEMSKNENDDYGIMDEFF